MQRDLQPGQRSPFRFLRVVAIVVIGVVVVFATAWTALAIYYSNLPGGIVRTGASLGFVLITAASFGLLRRRVRTLVVFAVAFALILGWWLTIPPSHDRDWAVDVAVLPSVTVDGDLATVRDIRVFEYRSNDDFDARYDTRTYDLNTIESLDLVLSYWDGNRDIAHTMLSFGFEDGRWLTLSIETRREKGEGYSTVTGFFKQFELIYVLADERDALRVRAVHRDEQLYIYPFKTTPEQNRIIFTNLIEMVNGLVGRPEWYNAIEYNCTTAMAPLGKGLPQGPRCDIRRLFNGHVDEFEYELKGIPADESDGLPFDEMRALHRVTEFAKRYADDPEFSNKMRSHLPRRRR